MARAKIPITVLGPDGRPFTGASVTVRKRSDLSNATVYSAETGGGTLANPLTSDASGRVGGWVDRGAYECVISGSGLTTYIEPVDAAPAGDSGVDSGWLAADAATGPKVDDSALPIGIMLPFGGAASPNADWLLCDGAAYSRATYSELFARIGTTYGAGDGSTTFNVPDLRGRSPVGKGTHADVDARGKSDGLAVASRRPDHAHEHVLPVGVRAGQLVILSPYSSDAYAQTGGSRYLSASNRPGGPGNVEGWEPGVSASALAASEYHAAMTTTEGPSFLVTEYLIRAR